MSAIEETSAAGTAGRGTTVGGQPSVATSTHAATAGPSVYPHLAYALAVHAELAAWELRPDRLDVGVTFPTLFDAPKPRPRELFVRIVWPTGHEDLNEAVREAGLTVAWAPMTGWSAHTAEGERLLDVDELAAPSVVAEVALHLVEDGLDCGWTPGTDAGRWEHALALHNALIQFDDREMGIR